MNAGMTQKFAYEIVKNGAVIWRCFSRTSSAVIPSELEGYPVVAIAPYAFSAHMDEKLLNGKIYTSEEELPALCGNQLEEVMIPATVARAGRYCFYNCKNLRKISFTNTLKDWGSGVFTGCHQVSELEVVMYKDEMSTLKEVLVELQEPLTVDYEYRDSEHGYKTKLVFPEYFEEGVENTPARIISTEMHGSGMWFRNCFQQRKFNFIEYDSRFFYAVSQEKFELLANMAEYRLRYPHGLLESHAVHYKEYLMEHRLEYGTFLLKKKEIEALMWFADLMFKETLPMEEKMDWLSQMIEYAAQKEYQEAVSYLMDYQYRHKKVSKKKTFDFDL